MLRNGPATARNATEAHNIAAAAATSAAGQHSNAEVGTPPAPQFASAYGAQVATQIFQKDAANTQSSVSGSTAPTVAHAAPGGVHVTLTPGLATDSSRSLSVP